MKEVVKLHYLFLQNWPMEPQVLYGISGYTPLLFDVELVRVKRNYK